MSDFEFPSHDQVVQALRTHPNWVRVHPFHRTKILSGFNAGNQIPINRALYQSWCVEGSNEVPEDLLLLYPDNQKKDLSELSIATSGALSNLRKLWNFLARGEVPQEAVYAHSLKNFDQAFIEALVTIEQTLETANQQLRLACKHQKHFFQLPPHERTVFFCNRDKEEETPPQYNNE